MSNAVWHLLKVLRASVKDESWYQQQPKWQFVKAEQMKACVELRVRVCANDFFSEAVHGPNAYQTFNSTSRKDKLVNFLPAQVRSPL